MAREVTIQINDESQKVPSCITVKKALELGGYKITKFPEKEALFVPCEGGGFFVNGYSAAPASTHFTRYK